MCFIDKPTHLKIIKSLFSLALIASAFFEYWYLITPQGKKIYLKYFISYNIILVGPINRLILIAAVWIIDQWKRLCVINALCLPVSHLVYTYLIINNPNINVLDWHDPPKWTFESNNSFGRRAIEMIITFIILGFIPFALVIYYMWVRRTDRREEDWLDI
nr:uncharacterized protein LOC108066171 [Drosophila takahashii]